MRFRPVCFYLGSGAGSGKDRQSVGFSWNDPRVVMKNVLLISMPFVLLLIGCGDQSKSGTQTTNTSSGNPVTAPVDYLAAAGKAQQSAVKTVDTAALNQAVQMFNVDNGRYPKDLNELVEKKYIPHIPDPPYGSKIVYDANAGQVKVVKQ
jgi:hypothetical protein